MDARRSHSQEDFVLRFTLFAMIAAVGLLTFTDANAMDGVTRSDSSRDLIAAQARAEQELVEATRDYQASIRERLVSETISAEEVAQALVATAQELSGTNDSSSTRSFQFQPLTKLEVAKPWILASGNASLDVFQGEGASRLQASKFFPAQGD